ncbi:MAG: XdhC/CoxI family protein, partial [Alphaproteobacteria bacterium]
MSGASTGGEARHDTVPETALAWHREGRGAALATVLETWGSAPRPVGSQLVVSAGGEIEGSVSGGCVEGAVIVAAQEALADGRCRVLEFGVSDEDAFAVGLACGGTIRVLVEPVGRGEGWPEALLAELVAARAAREQVAVVTDLASWERRLHRRPEGPHAAAIAAGFADDRSRLDEGAFVHIHNPPLRMAIVGAVHIAQALAPMARLAGYDVTIIDPRPVFASS